MSSDGREDWSSSAPRVETRVTKRHPRWLLYAGLGCGGFVVLATAGLLVLGALSSRAVPGEQAPPRFVEYLRARGALEDGEQLLYFYAYRATDVKKGCAYFTDRRVVSLAEATDEFHSAAYSDIEAIRAQFSESWYEDSRIEIDVIGEGDFSLRIGREGDGDRSFERRLRDEWHRRRPH